MFGIVNIVLCKANKIVKKKTLPRLKCRPTRKHHHEMECGVPQGTILVALFFLLYINDLPNCLHHSQPRMYADDTSITLSKR